jgi:acyl dehydratase
MSVPGAILGRSATVAAEIDARWLMAYAASIGDLRPEFIDTRRPGGIVGHPMFPVAVEWPSVLALRTVAADLGLTGADAARGVHAGHHLSIERVARPGDRLTTVATVTGLEPTSVGALQTNEFVTTDADGAMVWSTRMQFLYVGVDVDGPSSPPPPGAVEPGPDPEPGDPTATVRIGAADAHVYTECARIWNPIHTDAAVAERAGLPAIILHGTATLAHAVSVVIDAEYGADPARVGTISGRFAAMVLLPDELTVRWRQLDGTVGFTVTNQAGQPALRRGRIVSRPGPSR